MMLSDTRRGPQQDPLLRHRDIRDPLLHSPKGNQCRRQAHCVHGGEQIAHESPDHRRGRRLRRHCRDRPHRQPPGTEKALEILTTEKGTKFEPDVVEALISVLAAGFDMPTVANI